MFLMITTVFLTERMTSFIMIEQNLMKFVTVLISDYVKLAKSLIKLAEEKGASKEEMQKILKEKTKAYVLNEKDCEI